ncbi:MAG: hypothetical protein ABEJ31_02050 [Haloarculaceae archaeon]
MSGEQQSRNSLGRRTFVSALAAGAGGVAMTGGASAGKHDAQAAGQRPGDSECNCSSKRSDETYYVEQCGECFEVTPLKGTVSVEQFYNWDKAKTQYSSWGTTHLQREDTSILFLYEDDCGEVHLVMVHDKYVEEPCNNNGGSVTFEFCGLPLKGCWEVQDDKYPKKTNYDRWQTHGWKQRVDWTWKGGRTDGGAYGPLGCDPFIEIEPRFNEQAKLYGKYYDGCIDEWQFLSGDCESPDRHCLQMDEELKILHNPLEDLKDEFEKHKHRRKRRKKWKHDEKRWKGWDDHGDHKKRRKHHEKKWKHGKKHQKRRKERKHWKKRFGKHGGKGDWADKFGKHGKGKQGWYHHDSKSASEDDFDWWG